VFLRLTIKGGILNKTINEYSQMILNLIGLNLSLTLILLLHDSLEFLGNDIGNVIDMSPTLRGGNGIDK
jgi:hypothetical protein